MTTKSLCFKRLFSVMLVIGPTWGFIDKMARYVDLANEK